MADEAGGLGTYLHQLFQRSFSVAKEVRSTTEIGAHSVSMAAAAVRLSQRIFDKVADQNVLFIGAGEMIELCATHFAAQNPKTHHHRQPHHGARRSAGAPLQRPRDPPGRPARAAAAVRHRRLLHRVDPAADRPRAWSSARSRRAATSRCSWSTWRCRAISNPKSARLDDVFLYTVDDLGQVVQTGIESRQAAVAQAEAIIETRVQSFMHWIDDRAVVPVIQDLQENSEAMRLFELERARKMLARGDDVEAVLEALSKGLTAKFLHGPQQALHRAQGDERARLASLLPQLFRGRR